MFSKLEKFVSELRKKGFTIEPGIIGNGYRIEYKIDGRRFYVASIERKDLRTNMKWEKAIITVDDKSFMEEKDLENLKILRKSVAETALSYGFSVWHSIGYNCELGPEFP